MDSLVIALSWTPLILVFVLAFFFRTPALSLSLWAFSYTVFLVLSVFKTAPRVVLMATLDGILTTVPLLLVVYLGILLSVFLLDKGVLQRLASWLSLVRPGHIKQATLLAVGVGNFMEGAGIIAEPVAAPVIRASGVEPKASAILSILGYSGLMHLSLAGVIVTVLATVTGLPVLGLAWDLGILSYPASILLCLSIPWIINKRYHWKEGLAAILLSGALAASVALLAVEFLGYSVAGMMGGMVVIVFFYGLAGQVPRGSPTLWRDLAPFILIFVCLSSVNLIHPIRQIVFDQWILSIRLIPQHTIRLRPLFDAYTYLILAFWVSFLLHSDTGESVWSFVRKANQKALKAVIAMALFGAVGQIIAYSGYSSGFEAFEPRDNIANCLAQSLIASTGRFYPVFAPFLGWIGTFLTGYGVASIMLFARLQLETAAIMGISPSILVCAMTVGASIGSISSPFKIAIATPLCGAEGREGEILRETIPLGLAVSLGIGLFTLFWLQL
jgi:lactate permease